MNENPKVIQQLLGHKDVKTMIGIYNSVNSDYVQQATDKLNEKIVEDEMKREQDGKEKKEKEEEEQKQLSDEEFDRKVAEMLREQEERKRRRKERDFEV